MKKIHVIALIIITPFLLTACAKPEDHESNDLPPPPPETTKLPDDVAMSVERPADAPETLLDNITNVLATGKSVMCDYVDEDGTVISTYIKNNKVYSEGEVSLGEKTSMIGAILKDNKYYAWQIGATQGMILDLQAPKGNPYKMGEKEIRSTSDVIGVLQAKKELCRVQEIEESLFELPSGVDFQPF